MCLDRRQLKGGDIESDWNGSLDHSVAKCIIMEWWWWWKIKLWKIKCDGRRWQWAKAAIRDEDAIRSNQNDEKKFYVCITMKNVMVLFARCSWKIMVPVVINIRWNSNFYSRFWHFVSTFRVSDAWKLKWAILYVCVCDIQRSSFYAFCICVGWMKEIRVLFKWATGFVLPLHTFIVPYFSYVVELIRRRWQRHRLIHCGNGLNGLSRWLLITPQPRCFNSKFLFTQRFHC